MCFNKRNNNQLRIFCDLSSTIYLCNVGTQVMEVKTMQPTKNVQKFLIIKYKLKNTNKSN